MRLISLYILMLGAFMSEWSLLALKVFCGKCLQVPKIVVPLHLQTGRNASLL